jgi:serine/threonine protein kinase
MPVRIVSMDELIPGYRLLEPLGRGGFGEVWKATAPGGLLKAIKLVHGSFACAVGGAEHVQKELRALDCVKGIRHPFLLSLDRFDVVLDHLLIVMELADRNLWDRFQECRTQGKPGIPRAELLHYLAEAAEGLDLLSQRHGLQHSDVKPQNLFLVGHHVKVGDFGQVRDLEGMKAAVGSGVSPLYAAPETFQGWVSCHSDQYSLAIVYQELLTGKRPFDGTNARQLFMQHVQKPPDLTSLPPGDRPVVGRALAKEPDERFPSCGTFVSELRRANPPLLRRGERRKAAAEPARRTVLARPQAPKTMLATDLLARSPQPSEMLAVRCPNCGFTGEVPLKFQGRPVKCRSCRKVFPAAAFTDVAKPTPAAEAEVKKTVAEIEAPTSVFFEVECPVCGNSGQVPETYRGRRLRCRQCGCVHRENAAPAGALAVP